MSGLSSQKGAGEGVRTTAASPSSTHSPHVAWLGTGPQTMCNRQMNPTEVIKAPQHGPVYTDDKQK